MREALWWRKQRLWDAELAEASVGVGEHVRLIMEEAYQHAMMDRIIDVAPGDEPGAWQVWLETGQGKFRSDTPAFHARVGIMIRRRGLLANLSLRENLLLPFLYHGDAARIARAEQEVEAVADFLGLWDVLDEQAGERSNYTHALLSLGRCMLMHPAIIVAQEIHVGMSPERQMHFRDLAIEALQQLGSGLLYLTSTEHEGSGVHFDRTLVLQAQAVQGMA
jgi:ABC-type multidrug transport system ATPase subunit